MQRSCSDAIDFFHLLINYRNYAVIMWLTSNIAQYNPQGLPGKRLVMPSSGKSIPVHVH